MCALCISAEIVCLSILSCLGSIHTVLHIAYFLCKQYEQGMHHEPVIKPLRRLLEKSNILKFSRFIRMSPERFEHLHSLIEPYLISPNSRVSGRRPISTKEKLTVTLHHLATGDSQQSEAFDFRLGRSTVSQIVKVSF